MDNAEVTPPHTGKMYFSGRKRASRFPKTCEAEQIPVIQLKAAALLLISTTSACQRKGKCNPKYSLLLMFSITKEKLLPHKQQKCRKYSLDLKYMILYEAHSKHIQIP